MHLPRRAPRLLTLFALLLATALIGPAAASAAKVTGPGPWKASNTYLVRADLDGRTKPQLNPVAKVNHVKAGQWISIQCQTTGETAYGSDVWIKTGGLYVPDHYVKTYTDGLLAGVPACDTRTPKPTPAPPASTSPTRADLANAVSSVEYERVYGSNWKTYKKRFPGTYPAGRIIWKKNGCSVPKKAYAAAGLTGPVNLARLAYYSRVFRKSCDRHDFGYRNYGSASAGMQLDPTEKRRASIDKHFRSNMKIQCSRQKLMKATCYTFAQGFYIAVSKGAKSHFFK